MISISFAPNVEMDDVLLSSRLLFGGSKIKAVLDFEEAFCQYFKTEHAISFSSGRAALYNILKALDLPKDCEVLIQAFTCVAVPNAVLWAGFKPVYVDIDKQSLNIDPIDLSKKITNKSRVLVIQHTFGIPANIEELMDIARKNNLIVIEDCALCLGVTNKNKLLGTFGDIAFFSFGRDKSISSVFGGMVITKDKKTADTLRKQQDALKKPPRLFVIKQLLYAPLYTLSLFLYSVYLGKLLLAFLFRANILTKAVLSEEKTGSMPAFVSYSFDPALALLAHNQFKKLEKFTTHREKIVTLYNTHIPKNLVFPVSGPLLRYPLIVSNNVALLEYCKKQNIHLGNWYNSPIAPSDVSLKNIGYEMGVCPSVEKMGEKIINLPTHIHITESDVKKITNAIYSYEKNNNSRNN